LFVLAFGGIGALAGLLQKISRGDVEFERRFRSVEPGETLLLPALAGTGPADDLAQLAHAPIERRVAKRPCPTQRTRIQNLSWGYGTTTCRCSVTWREV